MITMSMSTQAEQLYSRLMDSDKDYILIRTGLDKDNIYMEDELLAAFECECYRDVKVVPKDDNLWFLYKKETL